MKSFRWSKKAEAAAITLANGATRQQAADAACVGIATLYRWLKTPEFDQEVDRLTLITDTARTAQRVMLAKRMIRKIGDTTQKDLLDWLKFAQSETADMHLGLAKEYATKKDAEEK